MSVFKGESFCEDCATEDLGGVLPEDEVIECTEGVCPYCNNTKWLVAWYEYQWPRDSRIKHLAWEKKKNAK